MLEYWLSPFLFAISSASLLWYLTHSFAIPPVVVKTRGVNVPCSISHYPFRILPLLVVFMLLIDLLRSQVSVRVYVRVTHPNFEKCRCLSLPWGRKLSPRKSVVQSACQYDVTSCFSDFQNGEQSVHRRDG